MKKEDLSCVDCGTKGCNNIENKKPEFCVSEKFDEEKKLEVKRLYTEESEDSAIFKTAAKIEGNYYCEKTRVEETVLFLKEYGAKKIGIVTCVGALKEAGTFANILRDNDFQVVSASCKIGSYDKTEAGIADEDKIRPGTYEPYCNPILQAQYMNEEDVDFVVAMSLCVGHDTLLFKHCEKPITMLYTKDRVTGHNAVAPLYHAKSYYKKKLGDIDKV